MKALIKRAVIAAGRRLPSEAARMTDYFLNYLSLGRFAQKHRMSAPRYVKTREELFRIVSDRIGHRPVAYLEFGVHEGESMRFWSKALKHPSSVLHGFDSFEGLPERWDEANPRGRFDVSGQTPKIDDSRVVWFKGWFADTLARYEAPVREELVIAFDADLYSSTTTVLNALEHAIRPGAYLYFDELADRDHEMLAFDEFLERTGKVVEVVGVASTMTQWLFRVAEAK